MERPAPAARRRRARPGEGDRLRDEILDATTRLLLERGDETAVSVRAVADAVGCTPGAIYLHFADRAALLFAVVERRFEALHERFQRAVEGVADPAERLMALGRAYVRFGLDHPEEYRILFMSHPGSLPHDVTEEEIGEMGGFALVFDATRDAIAAGVLAPADPFRVAVQLWMAAHGVASLLVTRPTFPWPASEDLVEAVLATQLRGLAP